MKFKSGKIIEKFSMKNNDGKNVNIVLMFPRVSMAKEMVKWINEMRSEALWIGNWKKETIKTEKKFIQNKIKEMRKRKGFHIAVKANGKIVGGASMDTTRHQARQHIGEFGIGLLESFTGIGLGYLLTKKALDIAKKYTTLTIIESSYNSNNKASEKLHKKIGFKIAGRIPRGIKGKDGKYGDYIILYKKIK